MSWRSLVREESESLGRVLDEGGTQPKEGEVPTYSDRKS